MTTIHPRVLRALYVIDRFERRRERARTRWLAVAWGLAAANVGTVFLLRYLLGSL